MSIDALNCISNKSIFDSFRLRPFDGTIFISESNLGNHVNHHIYNDENIVELQS